MKNSLFSLRPTSKIIGCLLGLLTACQGNTQYHSYQSVNHTGWYRDDTLIYTFDQEGFQQSATEVQLGIRHNDSYSYRDLWLTITPIYKDTTLSESPDTFHIYLADSTGNWIGHGIGEQRQFVQKLSNFKFTSSDTLKEIRIQHIMQDQPLKGINDIGICFKNKP